MSVLECVLWLLVGLLIGALGTAWLESKRRKDLRSELEQKHDEVMKLAKEELDEANARLEKAENELIVKQNIMDSLASKVQRQQRIIDRQKRTTK